MHIIKPVWLTHGGTLLSTASLLFVGAWDGIMMAGRELGDGLELCLAKLGRSDEHPDANSCISLGERKDFEVYSCDVSPDGKRLVTAAGGELCQKSDG